MCLSGAALPSHAGKLSPQVLGQGCDWVPRVNSIVMNTNSIQAR